MSETALRTLFVVNPRSAGGKTAKQWKALETHAAKNVPGFEAKLTEGAGHATALARKGLRDGFEMIVAVGGDGTNNEVINGFFDEDGQLVKKGAFFSQIPRGTGCDFARGQGISRDPAAAFARLAGRKGTPLDVGKIDCLSVDEKPLVRYFVNIAGFGANGDVVSRVNRSGKKLGGFLTFLTTSLASVATFKNPKVSMSFDGGPFEMSVINAVFVCNSTCCGGGMRAGPLALIDDGLLDLTIVGNLSRLDALASGRLLYSGKVYQHPKILHRRVKTLTARPMGQAVLIDADGEMPGMLQATFSMIPSAVLLKVS